MRELFQYRRQRNNASTSNSSRRQQQFQQQQQQQNDPSFNQHHPQQYMLDPDPLSSAHHLPPLSHHYGSNHRHHSPHQYHSSLPSHPRQPDGTGSGSSLQQHRRRRFSPSRHQRTRGSSRARSVSSQQSTATMTDYRSVTSATVPSYVTGANASVSRISDDETSWMSGVESQARSAGGGSNTSSIGTGSRNPYLRDGKKTKKVIDDLNGAEDEESTLTALTVIITEFDHSDTIKHNAELYYGAIGVLAQKLSMTDHHDAIRMICSAMEMAFRGGAKYVKEAFHVNAPAMMPPLLRLLDRCEQSKVRFPDEIILNITKTFHYWSRIPELRVSLARQPGLLDALRRVATSPLNVPSRNVRVRIIANLANAEDNKVLMYAHKGLLTSLLKIAHLDPVDATREFSTIALMDLASAPANQVPLANHGYVLKVLTVMVVSEKVTSIRESATTTLQNLAFPKANRLRLVNFQDGLVLEALLKVLDRDPNQKARRRAGGALTNLACEATADQMAKQPALLYTLAHVAIHEETDEEIQSRACLALTKIASGVKNGQSPTHSAVLDALVIAADTRVDNNISAVFRLRARDPQCREGMARHPGVLSKLAGMCFKPSLKERDNATRAIMHLANENINRKIMCNEEILEALIHGASCSVVPSSDRHQHSGSSTLTEEHNLLTEMQDSAIRAIARLATEHSNRQTMAKHRGLITAIARATERESKLEMKGPVSPEQQQAFLGKPLLMSLLMAM
ncbi:expressed unknown protein [Seminavis robusta]|uniref:Uncharacterized protein n=1 Tax=Seminavis robusta TaxID=568900 RepID=A0A9N8HNC1_9STRA|nr:expressed unknown protein [Seminavis robusta]|eukprot:Sro975_g226750.1 n/a (739) ;mRNA; r:8729-11025